MNASLCIWLHFVNENESHSTNLHLISDRIFDGRTLHKFIIKYYLFPLFDLIISNFEELTGSFPTARLITSHKFKNTRIFFSHIFPNIIYKSVEFYLRQYKSLCFDTKLIRICHRINSSRSKPFTGHLRGRFANKSLRLTPLMTSFCMKVSRLRAGAHRHAYPATVIVKCSLSCHFHVG